QPAWRLDLRHHRRSRRLAWRVRGVSRLRPRDDRQPPSLAAAPGAVVADAVSALRGRDLPKPQPFRLASVIAGFRSVFADPRAKVCFGSVFLEGLFIQGLLPYVALLLLRHGETPAAIAGVVIAAFGLGGVIYSISVPWLVA